MELASYLAGERWSDHPACTHPLLAEVARMVNDYTADQARARLAVLIPSVIGLTGDDPRIEARIVLRAATTALPVVAAERQRAMAVSVLAAEQYLAELDGRPVGELDARSRQALEQAPDAARWARRLTATTGIRTRRFHRAAPGIVRSATEGIAFACVPDPDTLLYDLLAGAIDDCAALIRLADQPAPAVDGEAWVAACELTGATR